MSAPTTLREKLMQDRERLYEMKDVVFNAMSELLGGAATVSYSIQNRSVTRSRADLNSMRSQLNYIESQINDIEALLSGRSPRAVITHSYLSPTTVIWSGLL
jgi:hypothetical protein